MNTWTKELRLLLHFNLHCLRGCPSCSAAVHQPNRTPLQSYNQPRPQVEACSTGQTHAVLVLDQSGAVASELLFNSATSCYGANVVQARMHGTCVHATFTQKGQSHSQ